MLICAPPLRFTCSPFRNWSRPARLRRGLCCHRCAITRQRAGVQPDTGLPWLFKDPGEVSEVLLGELARQRGARTPGRLVASAKSWLSHAGVDRSAPILPWGAADGIAQVSPVAASASTLAYIRAAWNQQFPRQPLERQELVLTVPASFDEAGIDHWQRRDWPDCPSCACWKSRRPPATTGCIAMPMIW